MDHSDALRRTYTLDEAARVAGVSRDLAYTAVRAGDWPAIQVAGALALPVEAFHEHLTIEAHHQAAERRAGLGLAQHHRSGMLRLWVLGPPIPAEFITPVVMGGETDQGQQRAALADRAAAGGRARQQALQRELYDATDDQGHPAGTPATNDFGSDSGPFGVRASSASGHVANSFSAWRRQAD